MSDDTTATVETSPAASGAEESETTAAETATPSAEVTRLDRLVGTWTVTGGVTGTVRFEWLEGGFFLRQHVDLVQYGARVRGMEVVGHTRPFGGVPSAEVWSRYYDDSGNTFDYVYELAGDTLTIRGGEKGPPAYYTGRFSEDGDPLEGAWVYPGGGGYSDTMTRVRD
ncbi:MULTISPECIES: hypothetical protein [Actinoalloteichus]|uniref:DUF1579 domain-containing protein n=1 Tax=Actinoalloteichus fjordicus TaxID=1612552 RepID=A0AAC9PS34_9PSEU|nr:MULTISPECIES: hypothetical protein [Actinoalloteichus]APU15109.1 hypothetical protein UA74_15280 [Actinoalloteichus fjordicus]APU21177.1 hypothetical protein UA75_15840 [Actinoalloteichus sp. GBA129-24]